jgi:exopolysaccharide/PEP-CTERM locus tyrosine autokinase
MSRIEDALQKLQARSPRSPTLSTRLATLEPRQHAYAGRRIIVDPAQLRANGLLALDTEERRLAEQYRAIKRPLLRNADPNLDPPLARGNVVMIASALPGEGKTFTCVNLCLSIARERDWTVILVDADCSKPHLTRLFAAESELGLIDLLRDPALTLDALVMPTDVPGLSLLPAGTRDPRASELLASRRMDELCEALSAGDAARMVVFDSSPLLLTTEAAALSAHVGQVALVVRANETRREAVAAALEKLDEAKAISCILNRHADGGEHPEGYGYYGYGYYNNEDGQSPEA